MTTTASVRRDAPSPVGLGGAIASEWIKFRGLTSNHVLTAFTLLLLIANGLAMPWAYVYRDRSSPKADYDAYPEMIVDKTGYVGIILAVLAVLMITNEYRSGQIGTTLLSAPQRTPVLVAKSAIIAGISFTIGIVSSAIGFALAPAILGVGGYSYDLSPADALRLILGSGLYLATLSIIGIAVGALIRNVVAGVLGVIVLLLIVPVIPQMFTEHGVEITGFFPIQAGSQLFAQPGSGGLGPWTGYLVLLAWSVALFAIAAITFKRRDA
ncbi:ABC transporter permease subunit [Brevibacterium sp. FAM 27836]|uniref:ABC transporter permease subunit n=1 Tax=Brevibacterium sp. FAM 27836 TaxID=3446693 RepID=UPI003F515122